MRRISRPFATSALVMLILGTLSTAVLAADAETCAMPDSWVDSLEWRNIGPANMSGRIVDLAVYEDDPKIWWAATASGGLLKTINNGISFEHQFTNEDVVAIGDITVAQSNADILWVGTGESNPRNSVSWGNGVYKSVDGGTTWTHMGLDDSFQIGRIAIHPTNPDIVYVGALGRLWGSNEQRGLFKTTDGGETWDKILYIDDKTGVVDVQMHPEDPDTLIIATYERERDGFDTNDPAKKWGEGSGLYRTTDAGQTFLKLTDGLPTGLLGRIGLDYYRADPDVIYAVVESDRIGSEPENAAFAGIAAEDAGEIGARITEITEESPAEQAGLQVDDIIVALDGVLVHSFDELQTEIRKHVADETVAIVVSRDKDTVETNLTFAMRPDAKEDDEEATEDMPGTRARERTASQRGRFSGRLGGQVANVQDQQGEDGHEYGGVYRSADGGDTWARINSVNPRPMYFSQIRVDPSDENYLYVLGVSLYRSVDGGKTFTPDGHDRSVHVDHHAMWIDPADGRHIILGNDGGIYVTYDRRATWDHYNHVAIGQFYHVTVGPRENYMIYGGLQDNGSWGGPSRVRDGTGAINENWFRVGGGDGFICAVDRDDPDLIYFESQNGGMGRINIATGERGFIRPRPERGQRYRFNWRTPFALSHHNSGIYYTSGNHVFRSLSEGDGIRRISPEITNTDRGSATAFAESPRNPDLLYVGTDDGALWRTTNGGHTWDNLFDLPAETPAEDTPAEDTPAEGSSEGAATDEAPTAAPSQTGRRDRGGRGGRMLEQLMENDENGDGRIQKTEIPATMQRFFNRLDTNTDGAIDKAEIEAMQQRRRGGQPGRSGQRGDRQQSADTPPAPTTDATPADALTGEWNGSFEMDDIPAEERTISLNLKLNEGDQKRTVTGTMTTSRGERDVNAGTFNLDTNKLAFETESDGMALSITASVSGNTLEGIISVGGGFTLPFTVERTTLADGTTSKDAEPVDPYNWKSIDELIPGPRWVNCLETSRFEENRVYVVMDGHRSDDDAAYVFVSENNGTTWRSLTDNLPEKAGTTRTLREDRTRQDVLYLGTEFGLYVSLDRGHSWTHLHGDFPTVPVHAIAQHEKSNDVIIGTHGRSIWILDATPLRQINTETMTAAVHLYAPSPAHYWLSKPRRGGDIRRFVGQNPSSSAQIFYSVGDDARNVSLRVEDQAGKTLRDLEINTEPGLHRVTWDLTRPRPNRGNQQRRRFNRGIRVEPGKYRVVLSQGENEQVQTLIVAGDPEYPTAVLWGEEYERQLELEAMFEGEEEHGNDDG